MTTTPHHFSRTDREFSGGQSAPFIHRIGKIAIGIGIGIGIGVGTSIGITTVLRLDHENHGSRLVFTKLNDNDQLFRRCKRGLTSAASDKFSQIG